MAFIITKDCIGCTACTKRCPEDAIRGQKDQIHVIDDRLCVECAACGMICPAEAVTTASGITIERRKRSEIPVPIVDVDLCSGCGLCEDMCAFNSIEVSGDRDVPEVFGVAQVNVKKCVGCSLCEAICIKESIHMGARG